MPTVLAACAPVTNPTEAPSTEAGSLYQIITLLGLIALAVLVLAFNLEKAHFFDAIGGDRIG